MKISKQEAKETLFISAFRTGKRALLLPLVIVADRNHFHAHPYRILLEEPTKVTTWFMSCVDELHFVRFNRGTSEFHVCLSTTTLI